MVKLNKLVNKINSKKMLTALLLYLLSVNLYDVFFVTCCCSNYVYYAAFVMQCVKAIHSRKLLGNRPYMKTVTI